MKRALVLIAFMVAAGCGRTEPAAAPGTDEPAAEGSSTSTSSSCVERYSLQALERRDYAFDGTVRAIQPGAEDGTDRVTFDVHEWFAGGSGAETTRKAFGFAGVTSVGASPHAVGERLLVAGDDDFVWECGFTQPYDEDVARAWKEAFAA